MPKFSVNVPHSLSQTEATERLNRFLDMLQEQFKDQVSNLEQSWEDDQLRFGFKTYGIPLSGIVQVGDNELNVNGELPFTAMMFKGKIESSIRERLEALMSK